MPDEKQFARLEVMHLVKEISDVIVNHPMVDAQLALCVLQAFIIDSAKDKAQIRQVTHDCIDFILKRARDTKALEAARKAVANVSQGI